MTTEDEFDEFAAAAWPRLRRSAFLLTGDHHLAEDLAQTALARTYASWRRVRRADALAYARKVLVNANIDRLRRRHGQDPARLMREQQAAYRAAGISPFAGMLPALAQGPALFVVYRLAQVTTIGAVPNVVLTANLFGAPLSAHLPALLTSALGAPALVALALLVGLIAVAAGTSRQQVRRLRASSTGEIAPVSLTLARLLPYGSVLMAAVVPVAVSLYLLTSATWMLAERALLPRWF